MADRAGGHAVWPAAKVTTGVAFGALLWITLRELGVLALGGLGGVADFAAFAIAGGGVSWWRAGRVLLWGALGTCAVVTGVVAATPLSRSLVPSVVRRDQIPSGTADAAVVLSAGVSDDGMLNSPALDRLLSGLRLVRDGRARMLVVTRPLHAITHGHAPDADWRRLLALLPSPPPVEVVNGPRDTHDEALGVARLVHMRGWRRVLIVTSPLHTKRACATFARVGVPTVCVPSDSRDIALGALDSAPDRLSAFGAWLYETVGWWVYWRRGWV